MADVRTDKEASFTRRLAMSEPHYPSSTELEAFRWAIEDATPRNDRPGWPDVVGAWPHEREQGIGRQR